MDSPKRICTEYTVLNIFYRSAFLSNLRLPWKQCFPEIFQAEGVAVPIPHPRTPMTIPMYMTNNGMI